ncbi:hypothetical protein [Microbulbifer taiwanensis]|uniref:hypothetical protein n=1 Tax=Microbulbifer taiwanensis TaxID=986746 RepID=UPI003612D773
MNPFIALQALFILSAFLVFIPQDSLADEREIKTAYPLERGMKFSDFPRLVQLAENVYGYEDIRAPGFTTVSMFVVGDSGVLLADGQESPAAMKRLLKSIADVTDRPLKWYVVGSDHEDHTGGNSALPDGVTYIVHPRSLANLDWARQKKKVHIP